VHRDLMIPRVRIDRAKEFKTCHEVHQSFNLRNIRTIFRASLIQIYEIYTHSLIIMVFFIITMFVNQSGYITSRIKSAMSIFSTFSVIAFYLLHLIFFLTKEGRWGLPLVGVWLLWEPRACLNIWKQN